MCFFRKYKKIAPKLNIENKELVIKQKLGRKGIKFGAKLFVPRNFVFATTKNGKILDLVSQGEYEITPKLLKETVLKLKLYKPNKKNKTAKYAPVEVYFVNLNDFDQVAWQTNNKVDLEDKKYGAYKISAKGRYNFNIVNAEKFLKFLYSDVIEITSENSANLLLNSVNNFITKHLYDKNYSAEKLYFKDKEITSDLFVSLSEHLHNIGINLEGITLESVEFPNKTLKMLEQLATPPKESQGSGKSAFENWQANNPNPVKKGIQFVTIEPEKKGKKNFFKESMAPYFFAEEDEEEPAQPVKKKSKWLGPIEKEKIEKSKQFVNLDDN